MPAQRTIDMLRAEAQAAADSLKACPFCGAKPVAKIRGRGPQAVNPTARCATTDCMASKLPVICLDVPDQVNAWNTRALQNR